MFLKRRGNLSNTIKEVMEEEKLDCISVSFSERKKRELLQYSTDNSRFYQRPVRESNPQLALRRSFSAVNHCQIQAPQDKDFP